MHTNFRLESGKDGKLYLFKGSEIVDQLTGMAKQPAPNIAYGRKTDGADDWGYQAIPTPGEANCGTTYKKVLGEPVFSTKGRVKIATGSNTKLTLSLPDDAPEGTTIRYTLDGSEPTESSQEYTSPLFFNSNTFHRCRTTNTYCNRTLRRCFSRSLCFRLGSHDSCNSLCCGNRLLSSSRNRRRIRHRQKNCR